MSEVLRWYREVFGEPGGPGRRWRVALYLCAVVGGSCMVYWGIRGW